jgi:hypothetical protein
VRAGVPGELLFTVRTGARCSLAGVQLRTLSRTDYLADVPCRFAPSPDGSTVALDFGCASGRPLRLQSLETDYSVEPSPAGCLPAWRPSGLLTFVHDGEVLGARTRECAAASAGCFDILIPSGRAGRVAGLAWLEEDRALAAVRRSREQRLLIFVRGRAAATAEGFVLGRVRKIAADASGGFIVAAQGDGTSVILTAEATGKTSFAQVQRPDTRAVTLSPDGRWLARSRPGSVCIFERDALDRAVGCVDVYSIDLGWRR